MSIANLLTLNVNEHTEKKANLTYLSWAWAWAEALKADPQATFNVQMFGDKCYMEINGTAMVWVTVTMFGKPMVCQLPVMDNSNKPITIEGTTTINKYGKEVITKLDSFNVNTAIMRCMTKALSLHGLGLYIYSGDDLPSFVEPESTIEPDTMTDLFAAIESASTQDELKIAYKVAYAACDGDKAWQIKVIAAKDKAKAKL
jgi:hypothetical protein